MYDARTARPILIYYISKLHGISHRQQKSLFSCPMQNYAKAIMAYLQDIAQIYEILHCHQLFIIPSKATAWDTCTMNQNSSTVEVSTMHSVQHPQHPFSILVLNPEGFQQQFLLKSESECITLLDITLHCQGAYFRNSGMLPLNVTKIF